eukprot:TRINITY_DN3432_c0_g2_i1.p1 TRINITY_DN3432_c0_g2~~TRINITY_DN3432_c0_g2_i1.p1  ORF type:complete len:432 (+),score=135.16 TRINITY_DN3432_c0_g2_i1:58-1296(+)
MKFTAKDIVCCVAIVSIILTWVLWTEVAVNVTTDQDYYRPFLTVWLSQVPIMLLLPIGYFMMRVVAKKEGRAFTLKSEIEKYGFTIKSFIFHMTWIGVFYFLPNFCWFDAIAEEGMTLSIGTVVFNSSAAFVFLFSMIFLGEKFNWMKGCSLVLSVVGVIIISLAKDEDGGDWISKWVMMIFFGAITYGLWEVVYVRWGCNRADLSVSMVTFITGMMGLVGCCFGLLCFFPLHWTGFEEYPTPTWETVWSLVANGVAGALYNISFLVGLGTARTPVLVAMAILLTIPATSISDYFLHDVTMNGTQFIGAGFVSAGFIWLTLKEHYDHKKAQESKNKAPVESSIQDEDLSSSAEENIIEIKPEESSKSDDESSKSDSEGSQKIILSPTNPGSSDEEDAGEPIKSEIAEVADRV